MLFYYSLAAAFLALIIAFYHYRATILLHIHLPERMRTMFPRTGHYTPLSTFSEQINAGMTSSQFDIEANLRDSDTRSGLDDRGTQEVMEIMQQQRVK
ncbi:hypothetical protein H2248_010453 [Termitomyces sp. 'cryptogamus']|nr:hypothetical protein H2248_010453 [Termitomyces sp. 'cryptogamus']